MQIKKTAVNIFLVNERNQGARGNPNAIYISPALFGWPSDKISANIFWEFLLLLSCQMMYMHLMNLNPMHASQILG
jgi:hypothetical protein